MNKQDNIAEMIRRSELYASSESEKEKKTEHYKKALERFRTPSWYQQEKARSLCQEGK